MQLFLIEGAKRLSHVLGQSNQAVVTVGPSNVRICGVLRTRPHLCCAMSERAGAGEHHGIIRNEDVSGGDITSGHPRSHVCVTHRLMQEGTSCTTHPNGQVLSKERWSGLGNLSRVFIPTVHCFTLACNFLYKITKLCVKTSYYFFFVLFLLF